MTDLPPPAPHGPDEADADELVARAIESVLEAVPVAEEAPVPDALAKYQPWADTATPASKNKRPLAELLAEIKARVAAEPDAIAAAPSGKPPMRAFFDRFGSPRREGEGRSGRGRRRRGKGRAEGTPATTVAAPVQRPPVADAASPPAGAGARRRRRRRGRGGGGNGPGGGAAGG